MQRNDSSIAGRHRRTLAEVQDHDYCGNGPACEIPGDRCGWVLLGASVAVRQLRRQIQRIAPYFRTALIRGEAGAGKEAVARAMHAHSAGADGPFVIANTSELVEAARQQRAERPFGAAAATRFESADGGTLFLTCVGDLSFEEQDVLFRFLRAWDERWSTTSQAGRTGFDGRKARRGEAVNPEMRGADGRGVGNRIIAVCDRDLRTLAAIGQFRQDLYARLSAVEVFVPPLRQRAEDIPALAEWLLRRLADTAGQSPKMLSGAAMAQLQERPWPNNLRELEHAVAQAAALAEGSVIEQRHLLTVEAGSNHMAAAEPARTERLHDVVQRHVLEVLTRCRGNKVRAAELLGISRSTLYRMLGAESAQGV